MKYATARRTHLRRRAAAFAACAIALAGLAFPAGAQDSDFDCSANFTPFGPTLVLRYEVAYRLLRMNLVELASATVHATDGEWFNEAAGAWARAYLMVFDLDTLEEPSEVGRGRYSIHHRLAAVVLKPALEPLVFYKRDFTHVDTFFKQVDVHNTEYFSLEAGRHDYIKRDYVGRRDTTDMVHFARLADQRREVLRFMKTVSRVYASGAEGVERGDLEYTVRVFTDNELVKFLVEIHPERTRLDILGGEYEVISFSARPAPEFRGKGRPLAVWGATFSYMAQKSSDPEMIRMSRRTFEYGMVPLMAEYGLQVGSVRCVIKSIGLWSDFDAAY